MKQRSTRWKLAFFTITLLLHHGAYWLTAAFAITAGESARPGVKPSLWATLPAEVLGFPLVDLSGRISGVIGPYLGDPGNTWVLLAVVNSVLWATALTWIATRAWRQLANDAEKAAV
jgi:hypothetical protein